MAKNDQGHFGWKTHKGEIERGFKWTLDNHKSVLGIYLTSPIVRYIYTSDDEV